MEHVIACKVCITFDLQKSLKIHSTLLIAFFLVYNEQKICEHSSKQTISSSTAIQNAR